MFIFFQPLRVTSITIAKLLTTTSSKSTVSARKWSPGWGSGLIGQSALEGRNSCTFILLFYYYEQTKRPPSPATPFTHLFIRLNKMYSFLIVIQALMMEEHIQWYSVNLSLKTSSSCGLSLAVWRGGEGLWISLGFVGRCHWAVREPRGWQRPGAMMPLPTRRYWRGFCGWWRFNLSLYLWLCTISQLPLHGYLIITQQPFSKHCGPNLTFSASRLVRRRRPPAERRPAVSGSAVQHSTPRICRHE